MVYQDNCRNPIPNYGVATRTHEMTPAPRRDFLTSFSLPTRQNRAPGRCGMAVAGSRVHPFANALNGKKLAHKIMCRRPKNTFPGIFWAKETVPLVQIR